MSQENVELIRRMTEAFNRGDIEGVIAIADPPPEFEIVPSGAEVPDLAGVQQGPEALRRAAEVLWGEFEGFCFDIHELIDAGDQVFASATMRGRGKHSGVETSWDVWGTWTVRGGHAVRWQTFDDRNAALEAAGLRE